jgi:tetratricopeptide (TPR) repeat protein
MSDRPTNTTTARGFFGWAGYSLIVLGLICLAAFVTAGLLRVFVTSDAGGERFSERAAELAVYLAAGLLAMSLLTAMGTLVNSIRDVQEELAGIVESHRISAARLGALAEILDRTPQSPASEGTMIMTHSSGGEAQEVPWQDIVRLLEDLRDNSLLPDSERQERRRSTLENDWIAAEQSITAACERGDFVRASAMFANLGRKYANDSRLADLSKLIEKSREEHEHSDVDSVTKRVEDLMSISAWQKARELAQELQRRHADSVAARQLLLRIEREHRLFQEDQRRRMYAEVQRFVTRRRWEEALSAARTFIERFPDSPESEALALQAPTIQGNAEIELRQQLEAQIMDYARHGRYIEAVELAQKVIGKYPDSPQADALRKQLPRLQELAHNPDAPPARVRIE